jgi:DNA replication and repair protein RecF
MQVTRLEFEEFRCFRRLSVDFQPLGFRLFGPNGSGKTSLIEALYLLATTKSFRTATERHLIHRESARELGVPPYARVAAWLETPTGRHSVEIVLTLDPVTLSVTKRYRRDGRPVRAMDFVGTLRVVLFSPEDIELVTGSPSLRRRYLDVILSTIDPSYLRALAQYARVLEQRNSLLKQLAGKDRRTMEEQLAFWDEQLVTYGSYLIVARLRFLAHWSEDLRQRFRDLHPTDPPVSARYNCSVPAPTVLLRELACIGLPEAQATLGLHYREALEQMRVDEIRRGSTLIGPHRDDLVWLLGEEPLAAVGSRGLQRLAVLAGKLAEITAIQRATDDWPVLLLDDVLSELDAGHRARLSATLASFPAQQVLTAADRTVLDQPEFAYLPLAVVDEIQRLFFLS